MTDRARDLMRDFMDAALQQQDALARFERERFETATRLLAALAPAVREAASELSPDAVRAALRVVSTTLAVLQSLQEARERILQALHALGPAAGVTIDREV